MAEVIISFAVSVIFDSLCQDKPVIEYYIYDEAQTAYTDDWRRRGFVLPANTPAELEEQIIAIRENPQKVNSGEFRNYFPKSYNDSTLKVVNLLAN